MLTKKEQLLCFLLVLREMKSFTVSPVCWMSLFHLLLVLYEGASKERIILPICMSLLWIKKKRDFIRHGQISLKFEFWSIIKVYHNLYLMWLHSHMNPGFIDCTVLFNWLSSENVVQTSCGLLSLFSAADELGTLLLCTPKSNISNSLRILYHHLHFHVSICRNFTKCYLAVSTAHLWSIFK